ncbi:hypothetical protein BU26DRAFT_514588 [Trematosphaeria pertusa]|uniref:Uncharacterized protein n=1 Tax=Trematosphaeria pertusa TaxID=390896 RepID=A0A6A6IXH6_9PLEO|nr:uncharacterized protein BU26DRAFT_514588 [Trematosphaeria pertusa]KAF2254727.1 hypothetical protein BU26DRAFT_514588 [Trematosphaeria pertusa]
MRRISILAALFLPLTLSASLLGMNAKELNGGLLRLWVFVPLSVVVSVVILGKSRITDKFMPPPTAHVDVEQLMNDTKNGESGGVRIVFGSTPVQT